MERKPEDIYQEDEIDLYELWLKLRKRWKLILSTLLIFISVAGLYSFLTTPVYESSFLIRVPIFISQKEAVKYVQVLGNLLKEERFEELEKYLKLDEKDLLKIKDVSARELRGTKDIIEVNISVEDPNIITTFTNHLKDYMNNIPYVKENIRIKKQKLSAEIEDLEKRIKALKETKNIVNKLAEKGEPIYFNPGDLDKTIQGMTKRLLEAKTELKTLRGFEITVEPAIPKEPSKPKRTLIIAVAGISALFLGIFLALFLEWLEEAKRKHVEVKS